MNATDELCALLRLDPRQLERAPDDATVDDVAAHAENRWLGCRWCADRARTTMVLTVVAGPLLVDPDRADTHHGWVLIEEADAGPRWLELCPADRVWVEETVEGELPERWELP
ncbi:hypothetical protein [Saccharothrix xinjiangensis]|uniref:Immunity protein 53 of polymorphic toxin system n=1 Tax=Saccharothrix xinjiangensis TaxID=204798 RepID=A0ABV9XTD5_9PSEU